MHVTTRVDQRRPAAAASQLADGPIDRRASMRLGAVAGALGFLLQLFLELFAHPSGQDPNDSHAAFTEYAAYPHWTAVHLGQYVAVLLVSIALLMVYRSLKQERDLAEALASLGAVATIIMTAVFAVQMAVDGVALKGAIHTWLGAAPADQEAAFLVADGVRLVEKGLSAFFHLGNGVAMVCFGAAIAISSRFPHWLGWVGVVGGLGFMGGAYSAAHTGFSMEAGMILMPAGLLSVVFIAGTCVVMWRQSRRIVALA